MTSGSLLQRVRSADKTWPIRARVTSRRVGNVGLARPMAGRLTLRRRHAQEAGPDVPLGIFLWIANADDPVLQDFKAGRAGEYVEGRLVFGLDRFDVRELLPQFADEANDLLAGLVAHAPHQVDVADREVQQVTHRDDVGPFQGIAGTGRQPRADNRRA